MPSMSPSWWAASVEMSSTPSSCPSGPSRGQALQLRKLCWAKKCWAPSTCTSLCSASAVPMALVPLLASPQRAPLRKKIRSAWRAKPSSPLAAKMAPSPSHSSRRQGLPASNWANSGNTKRWKQVIRVLCCSWRADSSPWGSRSSSALCWRSRP
ncbi:hypothetical protein D3C77_481870 [compost metagenome]